MNAGKIIDRQADSSARPYELTCFAIINSVGKRLSVMVPEPDSMPRIGSFGPGVTVFR